MPRRKDTTFVTFDLVNDRGQTIKFGDRVLFIGTSKGITEHSDGIYSGMYMHSGVGYSARIDEVTSRSWGRKYSILPLQRVFKLSN